MSEEHVTVRRLQEAFPEAVEEVMSFRDETWAVVRVEALLEVCRFLKEDPELAYDFLSFVCAVDYMPREPRFEVVYQLYSTKFHHRFRIKTRVGGQDPMVPSVTSIWPTADWHERETFDLMGIGFDGHPELRRILLPQDWVGHPLRKDYPLRGPERAR
ncbi:MAG: NADH-quinone oxidoreductase subunit C [Thermodesulfobacteriota bacterium]